MRKLWSLQNVTHKHLFLSVLPNSLQRTRHNFKKHLYLIESLMEQFDMRFSDFDMFRKDLILFENFLTAQIKA